MYILKAMSPKSGNRITTITSQIVNMTSLSIFWGFIISLVNFIYYVKFDVNIVAGSGVMRIFFYKGLTRNSEIGNCPIFGYWWH